MILPQRKIQISKWAEFTANEFARGNLTLLNKIADSEEVPYYFDNYENTFDGMLFYDKGKFHIHINRDRGNSENSKRGRFTLAHELGHFFIDEHRLGLKYGILPPHSSFHNLHQNLKIEEEADYFAGCLLMPSEKFRKASSAKSKQFSIDTLHNLSEEFQTSVLATLIRFGEIGTQEIFAVISKNNKAEWFVKSTDFPNWKFKFKVGENVPKTTVAGEYFTIENRKFTGVETVYPDDWFNPPPNDNRATRRMNEQCYYSDSYGYVISVLWFD